MNNGAAIAQTVVFTIVVPGTVAGYVPWRLRGDAVPVAGLEEWAAITFITVGIAIYLYTAFWGFALVGGGTPAPIAPTKILVVKGLHRFVRNPMYIGVALVIGGQAWLFHSLHIAIYMVCMLLAAHLFVVFYEEPTLHEHFGEEYDRYRAAVPRSIPEDQSFRARYSSIVIPNEVRDLHFCGELQIPHFVRDDKIEGGVGRSSSRCRLPRPSANF